MSYCNAQVTHTQHAFLVAWGHFARLIGLVQVIEQAPLNQKEYRHRPQTKVLEFFLAILAGLEHLKALSQAAHPLDQDQAVAIAWGQPAWADYSGVSRTLKSLTWAEVEHLVQSLEHISQPFVNAEVNLALAQTGRLVFDGDLTGLPVSNTSTTYPGAAFGHMDDEIRLGYQAAVVSLLSPTYGRLWVAVDHHPGDTLACSQAEALVLAAEARTGLRPRRRTELLQQRLQAVLNQLKAIENRLQAQQTAIDQAQSRLTQAQQQCQFWQSRFDALTQVYQASQRPERPHSHLAKARHKVQVTQRKQARCHKALTQAQRRLVKTQAKLAEKQAELSHLQARLARFEQDNATNPHPIQAVFRLDAGFGAYDNLALLIEMGYDLYTKPYSHQVVRHLKQKLTGPVRWTRVGANAEMITWSQLELKHFPYPLDVALERFYTGKKVKYSALFHYGTDRVTADLSGWFTFYNGRQTIEAGIKEGKRVFQLHHLKVRSEPAIYLQEYLVLLAANFIRWANHWLMASSAPLPEQALDVSALGSKQLVQVAAHTSAEVSWEADGWLLKFTEHSVFAGKSLKLPTWAYQLPLPFFESSTFGPFSMDSHLVAQNLG